MMKKKLTSKHTNPLVLRGREKTSIVCMVPAEPSLEQLPWRLGDPTQNRQNCSVKPTLDKLAPASTLLHSPGILLIRCHAALAG